MATTVVTSGVGGTDGVAPGTSGNLLTSDGTNWTSAAAAGGGAWTLIGTQVASASASLTQTGLDSTYDTYAIAFSDMIPATDDVRAYFRVGDSGGIETAANYAFHTSLVTDNSTSYDSRRGSAETSVRIGSDVGNATGEGFGGMLYLHRPGDGTMYPFWSGPVMSVTKDAGPRAAGGHHVGVYKSVITLDRVNVFFSSGNITSGRMTVWGIAHA